MPLRCAAMDASWKLLVTPQNKFPLLHVHLVLKEAQHAVLVGLLSRYRDFSLFYCLPHNASAGMLAGSSLALKSFSILSCINSISSISDRTALYHFVFIPVALIPVFYGSDNPLPRQSILETTHPPMVCQPRTNSKTWVNTQMLATSSVGVNSQTAGVSFV